MEFFGGPGSYLGMEFSDWICAKCYVVLQAANDGQEERCPKCDSVMEEAFIQEET